MKRVNKTIYLLFIVSSILIQISCKKDEDIIKIEKENPSISWENPIDIYYGTPLSNAQLNATANVDGIFSYNPESGTVLDIGEGQELTVQFIPDDTTRYNTVSKSVYIDVLEKGTPIISWPTPSDIIYGTLLSTDQLNATTDVPGTFSYSPPLGEKLLVGSNQILKVTFSPESDAYSSVEDSVMINVLWADIIFNTDLTYGTMTDQEGNVYKTITIGTQTWMAENLRTSKYRNGDDIDYIEDFASWDASNAGAFCWFNNDLPNYIDKFGALYNWYAVVDSRNIAPEGWHIPTDDEWNTLINYLGGEDLAGNKMKETGSLHWHESDSEGTNESGFTALPAGGRKDYTADGFYNLTFATIFWSSTQGGTYSAWGRYLSITSSKCSKYGSEKQNGNSVRCIKD